MSMCIHRAIHELEEGADYKLPEDIKHCLIENSEKITISSVLKGDPHSYTGLFYETIMKNSCIRIQNGNILHFCNMFDEKLPAVLIYSGTIMLYLPT